MLAFARDLDVQHKTAFVLAHKLRDAMAASIKGLQVGGEGRVAEIDGAHFGGHVRPKNRAADRVDRRRAENRSGKRQVVVAVRERGGRLGHHYHVVGPYLVCYAQEAAWREDLRRVGNGEEAHGVIGLAMRSSPSVDSCGYWQRTQAA